MKSKVITFLLAVFITAGLTFGIYKLTDTIMSDKTKVTVWHPVKVIAVNPDGKTYLVNAGEKIKIKVMVTESK